MTVLLIEILIQILTLTLTSTLTRTRHQVSIEYFSRNINLNSVKWSLPYDKAFLVKNAVRSRWLNLRFSREKWRHLRVSRGPTRNSVVQECQMGVSRHRRGDFDHFECGRCMWLLEMRVKNCHQKGAYTISTRRGAVAVSQPPSGTPVVS